MTKIKVRKAIVALEKGASIIGTPRQMSYLYCAVACLEKGLGLEAGPCPQRTKLNRIFGTELVTEIENRFEGWSKFRDEPQTIPQIVEALNRKIRYSRNLK